MLVIALAVFWNCPLSLNIYIYPQGSAYAMNTLLGNFCYLLWTAKQCTRAILFVLHLLVSID